MIEYIDWHPAPRGAASGRSCGSGRTLPGPTTPSSSTQGAPVSVRVDADRIAVMRQE
jgi:hypothetical protein